jgi:hypothetical protein
MSKLLAIVSTLTTLAVLATSATAFAGNVVRDHRHGARPPATNSPPPAAAKPQKPVPRVAARKVWEKQGAAEAKKAYAAAKQTRANLASRHPNSAPTPGKSTQQK